MLNNLDLSQLDVSLLACQDKLNPSEPCTITAKPTIDALNSAGITTDGTVPGGMRDYISAVLNVCGLTPSNESLKAILEKPEVKLTLLSAIEAATRVKNARETAENTVEDRLKNATRLSPVAKEQLKQAMVAVEQQDIKEKSKKAVETPIQESVDTSKEEAPNTVKEPEKKPVKESTPFLLHCPKCNWELAKTYAPPTFTQADKEQFLYCILGGTPFEKTFPLLDGKMSVTFKSLTPLEDKALFNQLRKDADASQIYDIKQLVNVQFDYELALSLKSITPSEVLIKPELVDFKGDNPVKDYYICINEKYFKTAARKRLCVEMFQSFQIMYKDLMDEVLSENFYHPASQAG